MKDSYKQETTVGNISQAGIRVMDYPAKEKGKPSISAMGEYQGWKEVDITIDSRACDTVRPVSMCPEIPVVRSQQQEQKLKCEVANCQSIHNEGQRRCWLMSVGSARPKRITFQVADVHKALLSITRVADAGYDCYLTATGGQLIERKTGEVSPISRRGNLYVMKAWVRADEAKHDQPFQRQGP